MPGFDSRLSDTKDHAFKYPASCNALYEQREFKVGRSASSWKRDPGDVDVVWGKERMEKTFQGRREKKRESTHRRRSENAQSSLGSQ